MINIDGEACVTENVIRDARDELAALLKEEWAATLTVDLLDAAHLELELAF